MSFFNYGLLLLINGTVQKGSSELFYRKGGG